MERLPNKPPSPTLKSGETAPSGKLLRRSEAARLLGVSTSTLRRREGDLLKPVVGPDGVHLFDESEVRSVMVTVRRRQATAALGPSIGDAAAEVFTLLDAGEHPVEIVKQLRIAPDVVISLNEQWAHMRSAFLVNRDEAKQIGRLSQAPAPTNALSAIAQIRQRVERLVRARRGSATCHECGETTASTCEPCIVATYAPIGTHSVRIERRLPESGVDEVRAVADVYWNDPIGEGGDVVQLRSDWYPVGSVDQMPIGEIVRGVGLTQAGA